MPDSSPFQWSGVSGTLLLTLHARALESLSKHPFLSDLKAVEIVRGLEPVLRVSPALLAPAAAFAREELRGDH
ncbi:MAG TPA: hypothetical protein VGK67_28745 [Myxococcales bacterium]|jgi:O-methyltransferase involved in polyketide biosynthesis